MIALAVQGLNLGIDFKGGTQFTFKTHKPYSTGAVQSFMASQGQPDAVVQGTGQTTHGELSELAGPDEDAHERPAGQPDAGASSAISALRGRLEERLRDVRPPDRESTRSTGSSSRCS